MHSPSRSTGKTISLLCNLCTREYYTNPNLPTARKGQIIQQAILPIGDSLSNNQC